MDSPRVYGTYHPELISRRGEAIAWTGVLLVAAGWVVLRLYGQPVPFMLPLLGVPLLLAALGISLGNWMDRHTVLRLEPGGLTYHNGLRHVRLKWVEIQRVRVLPAAWGKKVQVFGRQAYFAFNTLGEVIVQGRTLGRVGFAAGDQILDQILRNADLHPVQSSEASGVGEIHDYARD
jgi:hypothetical protein